MTDLLLQAIAIFVVAIDPLGMVPIFIGVTAHLHPSRLPRTALKACSIAALILLAFTFGGEWLLRMLGVGVPAFRIAGGILLLLLAIDMLFARASGLRSTTEPENLEAHEREDVAVFPLAIPLIAGPGALTSAVLLMGNAGPDPARQAVVVAVLLGTLALTLLLLVFAGRVAKLMGVTGTNVVSRVLGIITAALACQFILDGLRGSQLF